MGRYFRIFASNRGLLIVLLGYTYFWFAGQLMQMNLQVFAKSTLGLEKETWIGLIQAGLALGIGTGSVLAGYLSRGRIELGMVPFGALGLALFGSLMVFPGGYWASVALLAGMGMASGFYEVPLASGLQARSPKDAKGGIIAASNVVTFASMGFAALLFKGLSMAGVDTRTTFLLLGVLSLCTGGLLCVVYPYFLQRFIVWLFASTVYRIRVVGRENVPAEGGALLLPNHMCYADPGFVISVVDRPIRFLAFREYMKNPLLKPFYVVGDAIPISATDGPAALVQSLAQATEALRHGQLVCLFPEGGISRTGQLNAFQKGYQRILRGVDVPIVPVHIDGTWGSLFSFSEERFFSKWPLRIPYRVTVRFGKPLPPTASPYAVRRAILELGAESWQFRKEANQLLHRVFVRIARRHPRLIGVADLRSGALSYIKTLTASIILGRKLRVALDDQPMVGILVPPSVGGVLTNLAIQFMGRTAVNLNYTGSAEAIASAAQQCKMTHCITAKAFLERFPVQVPGMPIYLEDIMASVKPIDRIAGLLLALFCPVRLLERHLGGPRKRTADDVAAVIFSSGSEGQPKGVMLTHAGVMHNVISMAQVMPHRPGEPMMGILPFFHSFGFTGTIWVSLLNALGAVYHPTPLEAKQIGSLIGKYRAVFFIATPTFLQNFTRKCNAEDFRSLKYVICGAEKLSPRIRDAFLEKFGVEPLEGYGTTECSPVVSANLPDYVQGRVKQPGTRRGTIGRPVPGVCLRIVDPDTGDELPENTPGMLQVKGPNTMRGYLGMPEKTASVLRDGWYTTGDIAMIDEDGYATITDRLARFSKIAGEMVSHTKVEETLHELLGLTEQSLAVASVPDEGRGERLVVLHTLAPEQIEELLSKLDQSALPSLWRPRPNAFYAVESIPVLGTGKMDIRGVKTLAAELAARS